jgi:hypothetical protein
MIAGMATIVVIVIAMRITATRSMYYLVHSPCLKGDTFAILPFVKCDLE